VFVSVIVWLQHLTKLPTMSYVHCNLILLLITLIHVFAQKLHQEQFEKKRVNCFRKEIKTMERIHSNSFLSYHSFVISVDGVYSFGRNSEGQLGLETQLIRIHLKKHNSLLRVSFQLHVDIFFTHLF